MDKNLSLWVDTEQTFFSSKTYSAALLTSTIAAKPKQTPGTFRIGISSNYIDKLVSVTSRAGGSAE
jgi:hypothetical protein